MLLELIMFMLSLSPTSVNCFARVVVVCAGDIYDFYSIFCCCCFCCCWHGNLYLFMVSVINVYAAIVYVYVPMMQSKVALCTSSGCNSSCAGVRALESGTGRGYTGINWDYRSY